MLQTISSLRTNNPFASPSTKLWLPHGGGACADKCMPSVFRLSLAISIDVFQAAFQMVNHRAVSVDPKTQRSLSKLREEDHHKARSRE